MEAFITETEPAQSERRKPRRFPIVMNLRYRLLNGVEGGGESVNIGSGGLFFRSQLVLPKGELIEVELAWPASKEGAAVRLCVHGFVLRSSRAGTAIAISKYEFRATRRLSEEPQPKH
jgi:hypothetical protein